MKIFMKTDIGKVRTTNQDTMVSGQLGEKDCWAVVCDGMGGVNGGNVASSECAHRLQEQFEKSYHTEMTEEMIRHFFETALYNANMAVYELAQKDEALRGMGTTVVLALIQNSTLYVAHIGDSRALLFRNGSCQRLTKDHTIVQRMIDAGELTESEAEQHPNRHIITRAVGVMPTMHSDFAKWALQPGDVVLLCSDGLYNQVSETEIAAILQQPSEEWTEQLIARANQNGGEDNITAVLLCAGTCQEAE